MAGIYAVRFDLVWANDNDKDTETLNVFADDADDALNKGRAHYAEQVNDEDDSEQPPTFKKGDALYSSVKLAGLEHLVEVDI